MLKDKLQQEKDELEFKQKLLDEAVSRGNEALAYCDAHPETPDLEALQMRLRAQSRKTRHRRSSRRVLLVAATVVIVAGLCCGLLAVGAIREQVTELLLTIDSNGAYLNMRDGVYIEWQGTIAPTYIPEGMVQGIYAPRKNVKGLTYVDANDESKFVTLLQQDNTSVGAISTDKPEAERPDINGSQGVYVADGEAKSLAWIAGDYLFTLEGTISKEDMLKMARSIHVED